MNPESMFAIRHWDLPKILFVAAACFAMAAVGFFIAVFLQYRFSPQTKSTSSQMVPIEDKVSQMEHAAQTSPQPQSVQNQPIDAGNQVDASDPLGNEKLKLMQKLAQ